MSHFLPVAVDLGASHTGVWTSCYSHGGDPAEHPYGFTLTVEPNSLTLMMSNRTAMRHMRRNYKRRRLAKTLARLWLDDRWPQAQSEDDRAELASCRRFLMGLMNRRGFTHFSLEEQLDAMPLDGFEPALSRMGLAMNEQTATEWLQDAVSDPTTADHLLQQQKLFATRARKGDEGVQGLIKENLTDLDIDKTAFKKTVAHIHKCLTTAANADKDGHKARTDYFKNIRHDLACTDIGQMTCQHLAMDADQLANLLGHIGNLNLRALRLYFHDKSKASRRQLDVPRFHRMWQRFFRRWSFTGEPESRREAKKKNRSNWLVRLDMHTPSRDAMWDLLTKYSPAETIPPFEAQNNRRPPKCQSLLLNPDRLDQSWPAVSDDALPEWRIWAQALARAEPNLATDLMNLAGFDARAMHRRNPLRNRNKQANRYHDARLLQRVFDRRRDSDRYCIRLLLAENDGEHGDTGSKARAMLEDALGRQHVDAFLDAAGEYHDSARRARAGAWFPGAKSDTALLQTCKAHPPQKAKVQQELISGILNAPVTEEQVEQLERMFANERCNRPSTLVKAGGPKQQAIAGRLQKFSQQQKKLAGDLRVLYREAASLSDAERSSLGTSDSRRDAWNSYQWARAIAGLVGAQLQHGDEAIQRYSTPYSLAQLHNVFFTNRGGHARNCKACLQENAWRAQLDAQGNANAPRLPADSVRPFDGALARLLRAKARHIADSVVDAVDIPDGAEVLNIPLLLEENRFEFNAQLAQVKDRSKKEVDELEKRGNTRRAEWQQRWQDKWERIRDAGHACCPYCGKTIGDQGDFDHIAPRAETTRVFGYAFDAEANFVHAHSDCNAAKGARQYGLDQLADNYLRAVFGHTNRNQLQNDIEDDTNVWLGKRTDHRAFHQLEPELRRHLRHALFVPQLRDQVLARLANQNRARVNGTQRWFARQLHDAMEDAFRRKGVTVPRQYDVHSAKYTDVGELRYRLATQGPEFVKPENQPPYSHTVDAALVYAQVSTDPTAREMLGLPTRQGNSVAEFAEPARAAALLPRALSIVPVQRRAKHAAGVKPWHQPLLKAGMIGERFVPIGVDANAQVRVGFSSKNSFQLTAPKGANTTDQRLNLLHTLWPVLHVPDGMNEPDLPNLASQASERSAGILWLKVHKQAAFEHLLAHRREENDATSNALNGLLYQTQRVDLTGALNLNASKASPTAEELLNDKGQFKIKVEFKGLRGLGGGTVTLPAKSAWRALVEDRQLAPHLGCKLVSQSPDHPLKEGTVALAWDALMARHFPRGDSNRKHRRQRQVFSLPRKVSASGGFRARRTAPDGVPVYQLLQVEGGAYKGFACTNGALGFHKRRPQLLDTFGKAPYLTPLNPTPPTSRTISFDTPIELTPAQYPSLTDSGIERLFVMPGTSSRRSLRMQVSWQGLARLMPSHPVPGSFRTVGANIDLDKPAAQELAAALEETTGLNGLGPRNHKLDVEYMDDTSVIVSWGAGESAGKKTRQAQTGEAAEQT